MIIWQAHPGEISAVKQQGHPRSEAVPINADTESQGRPREPASCELDETTLHPQARNLAPYHGQRYAIPKWT